MKFSILVAAFALAGATSVSCATPVGWGSATTGGAGGTVYTVKKRSELDAALLNNGSPTKAKIIYVAGDILGDVSTTGTVLTAQDYAPGWDQKKYIACFTDGGLTPVVSTECTAIEALRVAGAAAQEKRVSIFIPPNTSIIGTGTTGRILGANFKVNGTSNVIIRNLYFEAPQDYFSEWSPTDGTKGSWNAEYDAVSITYSTNVWVDHCEFTDGRYHTKALGAPFGGENIELHDGLVDITLSSDLITVSFNRFLAHDKTNLLGSSDSRTDDAGKIRVTLYGNYWQVLQRAPRVRYGHVHVFNNWFFGNLNDTDYPMISDSFGGAHYFLGLGVESQIVAEYNAFDYVAKTVTPALNASVALWNWGGNVFSDKGSFFNGAAVNLTAIAAKKFAEKVASKLASDAAAGKTSPAWTTKAFTSDTWKPASTYTYSIARTDYMSIKVYVGANAGVGKPL